MKKTLLAALMLPALGAATAAHAYQGKLDIDGTIVDNSPKWSHGIPAAAAKNMKDVHLEVSNGKLTPSKNELEFELPKAAQSNTAFQSHMPKPRVMGGPGLTPEISITQASGDTTVPVNSGQYMDVTIKATGTRAGQKVTDGKLTFKMLAANVIAVNDGQHSQLIIPSSTDPKAKAAFDAAIADAKAQLASTTAWGTKFKGITEAKGSNDKWAKLLNGTVKANPAPAAVNGKTAKAAPKGYFQSSLSSKIVTPKVTFNKSDLPDTWSATLPITITMK